MPLSVYINSMVIAGSEPAIIDTGTINNRSQWLEDVFGIVGAQGMAMFIHHALSPWLGLVDPVRYAAEVDRVQALGMTTIATALSALITPDSVADAFALLRDLPNVTVPPAPDQTALDAVLTATASAGV